MTEAKTFLAQTRFGEIEVPAVLYGRALVEQRERREALNKGIWLAIGPANSEILRMAQEKKRESARVTQGSGCGTPGVGTSAGSPGSGGC